MTPNRPRIAIVCDYLTTMGGAEKVVLAMHDAFPSAPIYTALYRPEGMPEFAELDVRTSRLQNLPKKLRKHPRLLPTMAIKAMRALDLSSFDIILTSSYLHGHQVTKARPDQIIINYCHTPPRYYWSHYDEYRRDPGYGRLNPIVRGLMPLLVPRQRRLDIEAAENVDLFIANSNETAARIERYYNRKSTVIHPPVNTKRFKMSPNRSNFYVTIGRQLPYKRYDLVIEAANKLKLPLKVFGNGPVHEQLVRLAGPTIQFYTDRLDDASDAEVEAALSTARGFIFAAEEDFGIVQVEALAAGTPVIALGRAGTLDIITDGQTGILFKEQTVDSITDAIKRAEAKQFSPEFLARTAKRFDRTLFITKIRKVVASQAKSN